MISSSKTAISAAFANEVGVNESRQSARQSRPHRDPRDVEIFSEIGETSTQQCVYKQASDIGPCLANNNVYSLLKVLRRGLEEEFHVLGGVPGDDMTGGDAIFNVVIGCDVVRKVGLKYW